MEKAHGRFGWRVHAWVLMGNHFHVLLETPEPNLVAGMKWVLGVFSQGWNRLRGQAWSCVSGTLQGGGGEW
jgi:REP element-mobilizing transposase RayT